MKAKESNIEDVIGSVDKIGIWRGRLDKNIIDNWLYKTDSSSQPGSAEVSPYALRHPLYVMDSLLSYASNIVLAKCNLGK